MPSEPPPAEREPVVFDDAAIDAALAVCDGDARATIRALLIGHAFLEAALEEAQREASMGYVRGRPSRKLRDAPQG